jgi:hypothetical protein
MPTFHLHKYLLWFIASIWLINGLWCKVLGMVPRHEWIVARFTGAEIAPWLTKAIGAGEMLMAIWVLRKVWPAPGCK